MRETWVQSLGWEDPLEKGKATHSSILTWRIQGHKESDTTEQLSHVFPLVVGLCYGYSHPLHNANIECLTHGRYSMDVHLMDNSDLAKFCFPFFQRESGSL